MSDDILHTGRADIHHPKGPLTAEPAAQQPLSRDEQWEAEKVVTSLPGLGYDWTTINDYNAAQAWAVEAYLAAATRARADALRSFAEDLRRTLAALNVAIYWAHPDAPEGRDEIAGCRVALEMGQAALERLRAPAERVQDAPPAAIAPPEREDVGRLRTAMAEELDALRAEHPEPRVVIQGNPCCGGDGDEASCEECR